MQVFDIVLSQSDLTLIQSDIALSDSAATMTQISLTIAADTCKLQSQSQRDELRERSAHDAIRAEVSFLAQ